MRVVRLTIQRLLQQRKSVADAEKKLGPTNKKVVGRLKKRSKLTKTTTDEMATIASSSVLEM